MPVPSDAKGSLTCTFDNIFWFCSH